jgi:hypothetical protein
MTVTKIRQSPETLIQEVSDFVDFLLMRQDSTRWQLWNQFSVPAGVGGLSQDSVVLCEQIRVIDKRRIIKVLGGRNVSARPCRR